MDASAEPGFSRQASQPTKTVTQCPEITVIDSDSDDGKQKTTPAKKKSRSSRSRKRRREELRGRYADIDTHAGLVSALLPFAGVHKKPTPVPYNFPKVICITEDKISLSPIAAC